jgi:hypothetical protein
VKGSSGSNTIDFNFCKGTLTCSGGSDISLNADSSIDVNICGI